MHQFVAVLLIAALPSLTLAQEAVPRAPELAIDSYRLPNGLRVALHPDHGVPEVVVCVAYHVGSKNERAGRTGFAHFFEHMMFRGTKNVPNYDIPLQETGAQSNAFTSEDMTVYFETVSSEYLERALYLEAERLVFLPSALEQSKFDTEREVVKNERRQSVDNVPYGLVEETLLARVFPKGNPYSWSVIGSMKDLNSASLDDLKAFFAEFYHPANATLCLAGDFDLQLARTLIEKYFAPLAAGPRPAAVTAGRVKPQAASVELADEVQLPRIHWAWPTVGEGDPDAPALDLLATVLAGGETSRLYKRLVRDLRIAKDVSADNDSKEIAGYFTLEATAAEGKSTAEIGKVFHEEIGKLQREAPSPAEVARVLARIETGYYARLTRPVGRAITIASGFAQHDDPHHYRKEFARYFQVTPADVQRVAARYLSDSKVTLLVRPVKSGESKTEPAPVGPDPDTARGATFSSRAPVPGPDWTKLPGPAKAVAFKPPGHVRRRLSNGIDLWVATWKTLPLVQVSLRVPFGTGDDPQGKEGLANLMGRLLDQGTKTRTATELAEAFEQLGAGVRIGAGRDETGVGVSVLVRHLEPTLNLLAEMITSPRFDPKDFERERSLQLAGLLQGPDSVAWLARRALPIVMFGADHPYGKPAEGYPETVKQLTLDDVKSFHSRGIGPGGTSLIITGDVDPDELVRTLEQTLGRWQGNKAGAVARKASPLPPTQEVIHLVDKPGAVQSVINVGRHWVHRRDARYFATLIGNHLLGEDFLSRLSKNLREEHGYTYGAGSTFDFRREGSIWRVSTSVRADATARALQEILKELNAVAGARPITAEEIDKARSAEAKTFPEEFASPSGIAGALSEMAEFDLPADYLETFLPNLERVSPQAIQQAMTEVVLPRERFLLIVGDRKTVEPQLRKAGFKEIKVITYDGKKVEK
ncbi:MAG: M16 family metallopeptidase [Isosphaeraceae bacterium]